MVGIGNVEKDQQKGQLKKTTQTQRWLETSLRNYNSINHEPNCLCIFLAFTVIGETMDWLSLAVGRPLKKPYQKCERKPQLENKNSMMWIRRNK